MHVFFRFFLNYIRDNKNETRSLFQDERDALAISEIDQFEINVISANKRTQKQTS